MKIDEDALQPFLRARGEDHEARRAADELPSEDTDADTGLLDRFGIDVGVTSSTKIAGGELGEELKGRTRQPPRLICRRSRRRAGAIRQAACPARLMEANHDMRCYCWRARAPAAAPMPAPMTASDA
jgi:hypothetical protein